MKKLLQTFVGLVLTTTSVLFAPTATAGTVCSDCEYVGSNTYIGSYNPSLGDTGTFTNTGLDSGGFVDTWWFNINPTGDVEISVNFAPRGGIDDFLVKLYGPGEATCGAAGSTCTGALNKGDFLFDATSEAASAFFTFTQFDAGLYSFVVSGTVTPGTAGRSYSGQITTQPAKVPEPGTLALLGVALAGLALTARRQKSG